MPITGFAGFTLTSATGAKFEVDADGGELGADRRGDRLGQLDVVDGAERRVARDTSCRGPPRAA